MGRRRIMNALSDHRDSNPDPRHCLPIPTQLAMAASDSAEPYNTRSRRVPVSAGRGDCRRPSITWPTTCGWRDSNPQETDPWSVASTRLRHTRETITSGDEQSTPVPDATWLRESNPPVRFCRPLPDRLAKPRYDARLASVRRTYCAPPTGFEPVTFRLTVGRSAAELWRNNRPSTVAPDGSNPARRQRV